MGLTVEELREKPNPQTAEFFNEWKNLAQANFDIYDEIFCVLPNNTVDSLPDAKGIEDRSEGFVKWKKRYDVRLVKFSQI